MSEIIDVLDAQWFQNKKVMDIGCHDGSLDILIAARYQPELLIGVDIDHNLTAKAFRNMQDCINTSESMDLLNRELLKRSNDFKDEE